jgi:hypothetical protein
MQLNQFVAIISFVSMLSVMTACAPIKHNEPQHENEFELGEITITYLREGSRFPIHTTVSLFNYATPIISYSKKIIVPAHRAPEVKKAWGNDVFQKLEKSWQADLRPQDFVYIENLCKKLQLFSQSKVDLPPDALQPKRCVNASDIKLYVRSQNGRENTLTIPSGVLCQKKYLPVGIKRLMGEVSALVPKYQPTSETQYARLETSKVFKSSEGLSITKIRL